MNHLQIHFDFQLKERVKDILMNTQMYLMLYLTSFIDLLMYAYSEYTHTYKYLSVCIYMYMCICMYVYIHTHTHSKVGGYGTLWYMNTLSVQLIHQIWKQNVFFAVSLLTTPEGMCSHGKTHKKREFLSCADKTGIPGSVSQRALVFESTWSC